jgi:hypothetical protein
MVERNSLVVWTNTLEQLLQDAGAGKETDDAKLHFEARTPHALAALEAVLPGARFPLHQQLAALLYETWCRRVAEWGRRGHPQLSGRGSGEKILKARTCPGGHLGIPTRGVPCHAHGCPICAARKASLHYEKLVRCLAREARFGTAVELALVPAATADTPRGAGGRARWWAGTMYGAGSVKLVAMPAGTDWQSLPWKRLVDKEGWYWQPHYLVNLRDRAAIARAVGRVFAYDLTLLTGSADAAYRMLQYRRRSNATGVLRSPEPVKSLAQCARDPWTGKPPFVSAQPGVGGGQEVVLFTAEAARIEAARERGDPSATTSRDVLDKRVEDVIHDWLRSKRIDATVQCGTYTTVERLVGIANVSLRPGLRRDLVRRRRPGTSAMMIVSHAGYFAFSPRPGAPGDYLVEPLQGWIHRCAEKPPAAAETWAPPVAMPKRLPPGPEDSGPGTKRPRIGADFYCEMQSVRNMFPWLMPHLSVPPYAPSVEERFKGRIATIEDKAVRLLLALSGRPISVKEFRQFARNHTESPNLTFSLWEERFGRLPFRIDVGHEPLLYGARIRSNGQAPTSVVELLENYVESRPVAVLVKTGPVRLIVHDGRAPPGAGGSLVVHGREDKAVWIEYLETYLGRFVKAGQIEIVPTFAA